MKSMKNQPRFTLLLFLLCTFSFTQAQEYFVGVKGGVNYNTIGDLDHYGTTRGGGSTGFIFPDVDSLYTAKKDMGINYGVYVLIDFGQFFVRPEVNFTSMKNNYALFKNTTNWTANKIDIPIVFGYNIYKPISVYAGPVFSFISDMKLEGTDSLIEFDKNSTGLSAGFLIQYKRFGVDIRYDYGITAIKKQRIYLNRPFYGTRVADLVEYNPSQLSVSLTIDLFHFSFDKTQRTSGKYDWRNHRNL